MSKEDMVKEAVEEAKAKAAKEQAEAEETVETEDAQEVETEAKEATEEATETEGDSEAASEGKKKFFGKKEKKDKKDEKIEELTDRVTRQMAEFDNFRKRSEKEKSQMYEIGAKDIIEKILPVVDNFAGNTGTRNRKLPFHRSGFSTGTAGSSSYGPRSARNRLFRCAPVRSKAISVRRAPPFPCGADRVSLYMLRRDRSPARTRSPHFSAASGTYRSIAC